jgi:uncharacterized RDD family membrane protein YckC
VITAGVIWLIGYLFTIGAMIQSGDIDLDNPAEFRVGSFFLAALIWPAILGRFWYFNSER